MRGARFTHGETSRPVPATAAVDNARQAPARTQALLRQSRRIERPLTRPPLPPEEGGL